MQIKLIGAESYSLPSAGVMDPVLKGQVRDFPDRIAEALLGETWTDALNNNHPVWTKDLEAKPEVRKAATEMSLADAVKAQKEDAKAASTKKSTATTTTRRRSRQSA